MILRNLPFGKPSGLQRKTAYTYSALRLDVLLKLLEA
jgi:hypothetical protein